MNAPINFERLTPEELLPFVEAGVPGAALAAGDKLRDFVDDPYGTEAVMESYEEGKVDGRREYVKELFEEFESLLRALLPACDRDQSFELNRLLEILKLDAER